jgi:hypothetical protein
MVEIDVCRKALIEIAEINDISLVDCEEGLTKLLYELNDRFLEIQSIARAALGEAKREYLLFDQSADQVLDQFDPFPDEVDKCPKCGKPMVSRNGKKGKFYGCSGYPNCRHTRNIDDKEIQVPVVHKSDLDPYVPDSMKGEFKIFQDGLKHGDLNDQTEADEIFTGSHDVFGG